MFIQRIQTYVYIFIYIWVNYNISLIWIVRPFGMIPLTNYDSSEGEQWGRYNLPIYIYINRGSPTSDFRGWQLEGNICRKTHMVSYRFSRKKQHIGSPLVPPDDTPLPRGWVSQLQPRTVDPRPRAGLPIVRGQWPLESLPQILKKTLHIAKTLDVGPRGFSWKMGPMPLILRNYPDATCPQFWEQELTKFEITRC